MLGCIIVFNSIENCFLNFVHMYDMYNIDIVLTFCFQRNDQHTEQNFKYIIVFKSIILLPTYLCIYVFYL